MYSSGIDQHKRDGLITTYDDAGHPVKTTTRSRTRTTGCAGPSGSSAVRIRRWSS